MDYYYSLHDKKILEKRKKKLIDFSNHYFLFYFGEGKLKIIRDEKYNEYDDKMAFLGDCFI